MNLSVIQVSARRYVVGHLEKGLNRSLSISTRNRLGDDNEMIDVPKTRILTHTLDYETVMLMFCLLAKQAELTERQWGHVLQDQEDHVEMYCQKRHYGAYPHLTISKGRE